ncbi:MAG: VirB4 family type IV secretion system protein [Thermoplasmata archaeon]
MTERLSSTATESEGATWMRRGRRYLAPLLVRRFPPEVPFGFVGRALPPQADVDLRLEAHRIPPARALEIVHGARAVAEAELEGGRGGSATAELEVERTAAEELGRAVAQRTQELWRVGLRFVANGSSRSRAEGERFRLTERLTALGFRTRIPRYETKEALEPTDLLATESRPSGYWQTLSTDGLAALFPFVDETLLEPAGILVGLALANASPVFLDRWSHASYSWGIFGTTGSGKSFAASLLVLRTRWLRPETEVFVLDPLGEYTGLVRALGGTVVRLADRSAGRLNPLDPETTGGDRREKAGRVAAMLRALFPSLRDEEAAALDTAVSRLYASDGRVPTFDDLLGEVGGMTPPPGRLAALLEVFRSGSLSAVNGPTTFRPDSRTVAVDFSGVPDDQLPFHLAYVLDWAYGRLRSHPGPKLVLIDEAHLLARNDPTAEFLDRVVRHMRHFDAGLLLVTQNPDDFLARASGRSLLRNLYATAFFRLPEVSAEARTFFGLGAAEAEWLPKARLPRDAGYSESLWRIGEWHLPLAVVASTPEYEFLGSALGTRSPPSTGP